MHINGQILPNFTRVGGYFPEQVEVQLAYISGFLFFQTLFSLIEMVWASKETLLWRLVLINLAIVNSKFL
jgi:hypothetical protein